MTDIQSTLLRMSLMYNPHAGFVLTTVEAIGDITATEEASALTTFGNKHNKRVQGGLLGDGQDPHCLCLYPSLI